MDFTSFALFGENDSDLLSIRTINAFFDELKAPAVCIPFPADDDKFLSALPVLRSKFGGFNVSADYALEIAPHIDKLDKTSRDTGAVSTVKSVIGKMTGYDTDYSGFERSLPGFIEGAAGKDILLIGSGSLAYSVVFVLLQIASSVSIISNDAIRTHMLREKLLINNEGRRVKVLKELSGSQKFFAIFNTETNKIGNTPVKLTEETVRNAEYAYDVNLGESAFLQTAAKSGARTKDGFDMMFFKSLETVKIWLEMADISQNSVSRVYSRLRVEDINVL